LDDITRRNVMQGDYTPDQIHLTDDIVENERTTLMMRNIPNKYTQTTLLQLFTREGNFVDGFDFFYLPIDFRSKSNMGYCFINFVCPEDARKFKVHFTNFCNWKFNSSKRAEVLWSLPFQGLAGHIDRYRNSPVMHPTVPVDFKPSLFWKGRKVQFPPSQTMLEPPKLRRCKKKD